MRDRLREVFKNQTNQYRKLIQERGRTYINQYETPRLQNVAPEDYVELSVIRKIWKTGDKLYKLAHLYYNNAELWWVIALFNSKPTESHFKVGDTVYIPTSLEEIMNLIGYK